MRRVIAARPLTAALLLAGCGAPDGMVTVPAGPFYMGYPTAIPGPGAHSELTWVGRFHIDTYEVTNAQYAEFVEATGYRRPYVDEAWATELGFNWVGGVPPADRLDHPVVLTSWYDAREYCAWRGKRLPTEAEWEKATYGTDGRVYPWGTEWEQNRVNDGMVGGDWWDPSDGWKLTSPVGAYPTGASPYGAMDLFGNAWEWTADPPIKEWSDVREPPIPRIHWNPRGPAFGIYRAVRGGSYYFALDAAPWSERLQFLPEIRRKTSGFRCAKGG